MTFSFSKNFPYLRMRRFRMTRNQQNWLLEGPGMCSVVIFSLKFDNKSFWNYSKILVPKMCKIVVSWSLKSFGFHSIHARNELWFLDSKVTKKEKLVSSFDLIIITQKPLNQCITQKFTKCLQTSDLCNGGSSGA